MKEYELSGNGISIPVPDGFRKLDLESDLKTIRTEGREAGDDRRLLPGLEHKQV